VREHWFDGPGGVSVISPTPLPACQDTTRWSLVDCMGHVIEEEGMRDTRHYRQSLPLGLVLLWSLDGCSSPTTEVSQVAMGGTANAGGTVSSSSVGGKAVGGLTTISGIGGRSGTTTVSSGSAGGSSSSALGGAGAKEGTSDSGGSSSDKSSASGAGATSSGGSRDTSSTGGKGGATGGTNSVGSQGGTGGGRSNVGGAGGVGSSVGGSGNANAGGASGSSEAGGQSSTSTEAAPSAVTGLKVEANPKNTLSAFVSWTTDKPADSVVQFGQAKYEWEISDSEKVTSHKVLIIGMFANKAYQIKALSTNGGSSVSATTNYTSGALPAAIPVGKVTSSDATKVQPGWTLMNVIKSSSSMGPIANDPAAAVIYDTTTGQPVWYYQDGTTKDFGGAIATYLTDKGVLLGPVVGQSGPGESPREVDFAGNTIWECKDATCGGSGGLTHDTIKLSNGNHVVVRWKALSGTSIDSAPIYEELDSSGKVVWTLDFAKLVPRPSGASGDWCHGNSLTVDIAKDAVYANCRFMGLLKTSYKNPNSLIWFLPASYGKATGSLTFSPTTSQYSDTHDPEIHDDGTILFFDNGGYSTSVIPGSTTTYHSRAVEYKIDEATKTATLVWEFPGTFNVDSWYKNTWYNSYFGDADRLANGNVMITAGSVSSNNGDARVFEVQKADGKVVWEFKLDADYGIYRADRITPPLVKAISQ
jgi:hypothetical protein